MKIEYIENQKDFFSYTLLFSLLLNGKEDKGAKNAKKPPKMKKLFEKGKYYEMVCLNIWFLHFFTSSPLLCKET